MYPFSSFGILIFCPCSAAGCSTVLIPDRVAQVLNLNMDSIEAQVQHSGSGGFTTDYGNNFSSNVIYINCK